MKILRISAVLIALCAAPAFAQQIEVGRNVQISKAHSENAHYEVLAAADPNNPSRLIASSFIFSKTLGGTTIVYSSFDGGATWQPTLEGKSLAGSGDPACAYGPDGIAYYVASFIPPGSPMGSADRTMLVFRSKDGGKTWTAQTPFVYMDRAYITVDATGGKYNGRIYVNGNNRIPFGISDMVFFRSSDQGTNFQGPAHRDGFGNFKGTEMGNAVVASDGTVIAVLAQAPGEMVSLTSTDGGETLTPAVKIDSFTSGGDRKGAHNNANSLPALAIDPGSGAHKDNLYVVWPDRRSGHSEIFFSSSADKAHTWSKARVINDNPPGDTTDQFMPEVAVNRDGVVGVMWYDRRDHPDNMGWDARFTASVDGGATFLPSVKISTGGGTSFGSTTQWAPLQSVARKQAGGKPGYSLQMGLNSFLLIGGDTAGLVTGADGNFHPVWVDSHTGIAQLWTTKIRVNPQARAEAAGDGDISAKVSLEFTDPQYDRSQNRLTATLRIENTSEETLHGPFRIRANSMKAEFADLTALNADNHKPGIGAEWIFHDVVLPPHAKSEPKKLTFHLSKLQPMFEADRFRLGLLKMDVEIFAKLP